jgi:hypothetical protein
MTCSERNFIASQAFYGLCIAKGAELPSLDDPAILWSERIEHLVDLSNYVADTMIEANKKREALC